MAPRPIHIGFLARDFLNWGGGVWFIQNLLRGLVTLPTEEVRVTMLVPSARTFRLRARRFAGRLRRAALHPSRAREHLFGNAASERELWARGIEQLTSIVPELIVFDGSDRGLMRRCSALGIDVLLPVMRPPDRSSVPWVGYLGDCQHRHYPQWFDSAEIARRDRTFATMLQSSVVFANAKAVVRDLQAIFPKSEAQVFSLPFAPLILEEELSRAVRDSPAARRSVVAGAPYFIICNQFWIHKDHATAFRAFARFTREPARQQWRLVCTGVTHDYRVPGYFEELMALIAELDLRERVILTGYVERSHQQALLYGAAALLQPTLFEGGPGGGAGSDAIALGVPCVLSDIAVNRELADPLASFFRVGDPASLARAMEEVADRPPARPPSARLLENSRARAIELGETLRDLALRAVAAGTPRYPPHVLQAHQSSGCQPPPEGTEAMRNRPLLRCHDTATPEGRARERYRLAVWGTFTNVASRGLAMLLLVLGVRLTTGYLGTTRFGVWATFASMTAMLSLLDLGVGNALVNRVAHAVADGDERATKRIVTAGAGLLAAIGVTSAAGLLVPALMLPWGDLLKLTDSAMASEARQAAAVFAVIFGVNVFGSGLLRILAGQQRSHEAHLLSACAAAFACVGLYCASNLQAGVPWLLASTFGFQTLAGLAAGVLLLRRGLISRSGARAAMASERPHLLRVGSLFVLLQLGTMLGWGGDSVILALLRGAGEVAVYAVALRLFQFASQPFVMLNAPLWAAYADASVRGDTSFVRQALKRSMILSVSGAATLSLILVFTGPVLISVWTHGTIVVSTHVLALFAMWTVLEAGGNAFGVYLNGCAIVKEQVLVVVAFCAVVLPLKIWLGTTNGTAGLLEAAIVAYLVVIVGLYGFVFRSRVMAPLERKP